MGFAALNTGNNLLYMVLALMLAFLVLSGVLSEAALRGIRVRRRLPKEVFAERDARVRLEITNDQPRASAYAVVLEDRIASGDDEDRAAGRCFALRITAGATEVRSYALRAEQRGELVFRGFVVMTRFPFGLFAKSLRIEDASRRVVYPAIDSLAPSETRRGVSRPGEQSEHERTGTSPVSAGLRDFVPGDAPRRIHWPASHRSGTLQVRELESEEDEEVRVVLHTEAAETSTFERRVRHAASEVVALLDAGRRVALEAGPRHFDADRGHAHRAALLGFLARVEPTGAPR